mgnify:CR=1 FL=1
MTHSLRHLAAACVLLLMTLSAQAADDDAAITEVSAQELEALFNDLGYTGTEIDSGGVTVARVKDFIVTYGNLSLPEFVDRIR